MPAKAIQPKDIMASAGVLPWLVGLPATDTAWDDAPTQNTTDATSVNGSPKSEPGTMRSRASGYTDGTVARRTQSSSPAKQQSLAWKKRLVNGQLGYGDQTDLFGPSGLENIFNRTQDSNASSQKKHGRMGLQHRLSMDQNAENTRPPTNQSKRITPLTIPSSPPFDQSNYEERANHDSADGSPASQSSQSSVADMLSEMVGKMNELSESNKGYQSRMQAIKERFDNSEELRKRMEKVEHDEEQGEGSEVYQPVQFDKGSAEFFKSQRTFEFTKQTASVERRTKWTEEEEDQHAEDYHTSQRAPSDAQSEDGDLGEDIEDPESEVESRPASPQLSESEAGSEDYGSEIIKRQAKPASYQIHEHPQDHPGHHESHEPNEKEDTQAGAERSADCKQRPTFLTAQSAADNHDATGNRSITDSELEDLTPVLIAKRTTSNGKVQFNAIHTYDVSRSDIIKQRKNIDKTDTSQRAREMELAMGAESSNAECGEQSGQDLSQANDQDVKPTELSMAEEEGDSVVGVGRHVSGFTDAPEVEEDMPIRTKRAACPASWDFSEPPQNESSELAAAHRRGESTNKRSISFGLNQLDDYAFKMANEPLENETEITADENDDTQPSFLHAPYKSKMSSRESSPPLDVPAPGSRMPFEFRKDSLSEIHETNHKPKRKSSALDSVKSNNTAMPKIRSPPQASVEPDASDAFLQDMRSPPRVYVEDMDDTLDESGTAEGKRPLPRSPFKSPTPKRRRTLHDSELLQSVTEANISYHSQLQEAISSRKRKDKGESQEVASPSVLAQRKMARPRSSTPTQGPATKDYINEAKKVIELLRGNVATSSPLRGITEADEDETQPDYEEDFTDDYGPLHNTHKSDNMRTLAPQQVAHLIGGEMHGMTYDKTKNCWIRSKSFEHKQFLDPRDALSSDDDPFREISDLTIEKSARSPLRQPSQEAGATTVVHHELDDTGLSNSEHGPEDAADLEDTPQESVLRNGQSPRLPGEDTTLAPYDDSREGDTSEMVSATEMSTPAQFPPRINFPVPPTRNMPIDLQKMQLATRTPNANSNINNTFLLSDLPDFTVHEEERERPSERALATRLASYAAVEVSDPYALATTEVVKAITDVEGQQIHWEDLTSLSLHNKSLKSLHGLELHCARIEKLDVSDNALTQLDGIPPFVRELNAQSNQLISLTSWAHLMHLQYLDISNNNLESLDGLGHLIHLRELRVDSNKLRRLDGIADLDGLISLSARNNVIRQVNLDHFRFGRVVDLDLSENYITSIEGIEEMESLRTLKLDNNPLNKPLGVSKPMPRLRHLSLRSCGLRSLDVTPFPNLRTLDVDNNNLVTITGLSKLKKLDLFSMCGQDLEDDESITVFDDPLEAQTVRLSRNTFTNMQLEHAFMSIKHLELIDVGLVSLPDNFGIQMPNLRSLDLSYNGVRDIRPLAPLSGLETLTLVGCRVERLRKTIATLGKLRKLMKLDMKQNPLTQGFYGPEGTEDKSYKAKLDEETAIRRRTYELLLAYSCTREGFMLDGLQFDAEAAVAKDEVWERLVELGVLRRV